jgi:hypothetical protein
MYNVGIFPRVYGGTYPAMIWGAYMRAVVGDKAPSRFPAPDPLTTRAPKFLQLTGEQPVVIDEPRVFFDDTPSTPTSIYEDPSGLVTTTTLRNRGPQLTSPTTADPFAGLDNFNDFGNEDSDNAPRTSRVRPRDLTTLPGP